MESTDQAVKQQQDQINAIKDKMNQIDQLSKQDTNGDLKQVQEDMLKDLYALRENLCADLDQACEKANAGQQNNKSSDEVKKLEQENKKLKYRIEHLLKACEELEGGNNKSAAKHDKSAAAPKFEFVYGWPNMPQAQLIQVIADFSGVQLNSRLASEEEKNTKEWQAYAQGSKLWTNMVLKVDDKVTVTQDEAAANIIIEHGRYQALAGATAFEKSQVDQWISLLRSSWQHLWPLMNGTYGWELCKTVPNSKTGITMIQGMQGFAKIVDGYLKNNNKFWLVGDNLSLADLIGFRTFQLSMQFYFDPNFRKTVPHFTTWFTRVARLPAVVSRFGHTQLSQAVASFTDEGLMVLKPATVAAPAQKTAPVAAKKQEAPAKKDDDVDVDDMDLFGDDDADAGEAAAAAKAKVEEQKKKAKKPAPVAKSLILYEVKPWGEETDLDELAKMILAIQMDGLLWKTEYKKEPIAFGINKLLIGATVEDEKVSTDDLQEKIEAFEDHVQSVDIAAFNKV